MIRINLLPYRAARKKENIRIQVNIFLGSLLIIALLVFVFNSHLKGKVNHLNAEISSTQAQLVKYQQINKEIDEIKNNHLNCIYKELREIREGLMRRPSWLMTALVAILVALITYVLTTI